MKMVQLAKNHTLSRPLLSSGSAVCRRAPKVGMVPRFVVRAATEDVDGKRVSRTL